MSMNVFKYSVRSLIALTAYCLALIVGIGPGVASTVLAQGASPPLPPTGLTVTLKDYHSVRISWDDPQNSSITGYQVPRRSRDGDTYLDGLGPREFVVIEDDTGTADTVYTDTSVSPQTRYVYRVKAWNSAGLSEWSSYANAESTAAPVTVEVPDQGDKGGGQNAQQRSSSNVTLSSLTVDGATVPGVVPGATEFLFRVAESTRQVTLAATPRDSTSTVSYNTLDADDYVEGHQVPLRVGGNSITITVIGRDTTTTAYYTLTINRASSALFDWAVLQDLEDVLGSGNDFPHGIWSDGTPVWASGGDDLKLYAYELATGERESDRDI